MTSSYPWPPNMPPARVPPRNPWTIVAVALVSAAAAAAFTGVIAAHRDAAPVPRPVTITVTATPPPPPTPVPLPVDQANRRTCEAWLAAGTHVNAANAALKVLPKGVTVVDPGVPGNREWSEAVKTAVAEWNRAGDTVTDGIAPGTTPILQKSAAAAAAALHTMATADETADPADGNAFGTWHEAAGLVNVLCERLAP